MIRLLAILVLIVSSLQDSIKSQSCKRLRYGYRLCENETPMREERTSAGLTADSDEVRHDTNFGRNNLLRRNKLKPSISLNYYDKSSSDSIEWKLLQSISLPHSLLPSNLKQAKLKLKQKKKNNKLKFKRFRTKLYTKYYPWELDFLDIGNMKYFRIKEIITIPKSKNIRPGIKPGNKPRHRPGHKPGHGPGNRPGPKKSQETNLMKLGEIIQKPWARQTPPGWLTKSPKPRPTRPSKSSLKPWALRPERPEHKKPYEFHLMKLGGKYKRRPWWKPKPRPPRPPRPLKPTKPTKTPWTVTPNIPEIPELPQIPPNDDSNMS